MMISKNERRQLSAARWPGHAVKVPMTGRSAQGRNRKSISECGSGAHQQVLSVRAAADAGSQAQQNKHDRRRESARCRRRDSPRTVVYYKLRVSSSQACGPQLPW
jgi:hypothetical protein